jgi:hypothetical protein
MFLKELVLRLNRTLWGQLFGGICYGYIYWWQADFFKRHKRYIREEDNKFNKQVMDKLLIQMSLLVLYYLMR